MTRFFIHIFLALLPLIGAARELTLCLDDAIAMARVKSVDAAVALDELKTAYWEWRTYRADQLPEISFKATAPSYSNQYTPYMNSQGEFSGSTGPAFGHATGAPDRWHHQPELIA